jgi:hypothetical protein
VTAAPDGGAYVAAYCAVSKESVKYLLAAHNWIICSGLRPPVRSCAVYRLLFRTSTDGRP